MHVDTTLGIVYYYLVDLFVHGFNFFIASFYVVFLFGLIRHSDGRSALIRLLRWADIYPLYRCGGSVISDYFQTEIGAVHLRIFKFWICALAALIGFALFRSFWIFGLGFGSSELQVD
jgi:hypothetical protein